MANPTDTLENEDLEITRLLNRESESITSNDLSDVYAAMYADIKRMAQSQLSRLPAGQTITPTVLAHEAYVKMQIALPRQYQNRRHYLRALGQTMRHFLIDLARHKSTLKHGEQVDGFTLAASQGAADIDIDLLDLDQALGFVAEIDHALMDMLQMKIFLGLTFAEMAEVLEISERQCMRRWKQAKTLLTTVISEKPYS